MKVDSLTTTQLERYDRYVDRSAGSDSCWPWTGYKDRDGYGQFSVTHGVPLKTHRVAYMLKTGRWPKLHVLHTCDNPACCNPGHLWEGTNAENNSDKAAKGRASVNVGVTNANAKLTVASVLEMRSLYGQPGWTMVKLAARYQVSVSSVSCVIRLQNWRHVSQTHPALPPQRTPAIRRP